MAEVIEVGIVDGLPTSGTGEVPTLAPVRDAIAATNTALGETTDAEATGNGGVIALLKRLRTLLGTIAAAVSANKVQVTVADPLPAGSNGIGAVTLGAALPSGSNTIGGVTVAAALPAGDNNIGNVDLASAIPAGSNTIGGVNLPQYTPSAAADTLDGNAGGLPTVAVIHGYNGTNNVRLRATTTDGLLVNLGGNNDVTVSGVSTAAKQDLAQAALDAIEANTQLFTPMDSETVSASGSSAQSSVLPEGRVWVRASVAVHLINGSNPTATTNHPYIPAGESAYFFNPTGNRFAFIKASGEDDGTIWVSTESAI